MSILKVDTAERLRQIAQEEGYAATVDIDEMFPAPKPKRHRWGADKFKGSFVQHSSIAACTQCGLERHRQFDYGNRRTIFRDPKADKWFTNSNPSWSAETPPCGSL